MPTFTTGSIPITDGAGDHKIGSYAITESSETRQLQRINLNDPFGNQSAIPTIVQTLQKANNKSSGSVASLAQAFASNNIAGNTIVVLCAVGNGTAPTVTDSQGNTYTQVAQKANGSALNVAIFYANNINGGANTVTVNNGGSTASIAMEIYELSGLLSLAGPNIDSSQTNSGSSGTASATVLTPQASNEVSFCAVGIGTAAQTITPGSGWVNDSGQLNPSTPAGLFSFVAMSQYSGGNAQVTPSATFTSEPWAIVACSFRPAVMSVAGSVTSPYPTGSAVPANAFYIGINGGGNLTAIQTYSVGDGNNAGNGVASVGVFAMTTSTAADRLRTPKIFNSAQATASGDTAVWTPTSGKKFRIMRFKIQVTGNATQTSAGVITIKLRDATTDMNITHDVYIPSSAFSNQFGYDSGWIDLGNGILSASANNVLNVNLSAGLTAGNVRVITAGTEE